MVKWRRWVMGWVALVGLAAGCARLGAAMSGPGSLSVTVTALVAPVSSTPGPSQAAAAMGTAAPSQTAGATAAASITPSPSATPTLFPMLIAAMRQREYPGSDITIEHELDPGSNYRRYYASYLSEGLKIYALLTIPNGDPPAAGWPVIVFNHGYIPPSQYRTTQRYAAYVDRLAQAGYIVFRSDYRGHDQSQGVARGAYGSPDYEVDVLNAVASLKRYPRADAARIGMWGHSLGGYITLRAMVISPDIKAGVIWAGVVAPYPDLFARGVNRPTPAVTGTPSANGRGWRDGWAAEFGTPDENPDFWNGISANSFLDELSGPLQLHHGMGDTTVPIEDSELQYNELQAAGQTAELYTYDGDDHNLSGFFTTAMNRTIEFFDRYVK